MLDRPALDEPALARLVATVWNLEITGFEFLPLGNDVRSWAYRVDDRTGGSRFLKLRSGPPNPASVLVPTQLHDGGVPGLVPALPTAAGARWHDLPGFRLVLYPYVDGTVAMRTGLTAAQWTELGRFLRALHATSLGAEVVALVPRETFAPRSLDVAAELARSVRSGRYRGPEFAGTPEAELSEFWLSRADLIDHVLTRAAELGRLVAVRPVEQVLCHADIHTANVLVGADGRIVVIDWDEVAFGPPERDLKFITHAWVGGRTATAGEWAQFQQGYGDRPLDEQVLAYYRYEWAVADIGAYGECVFQSPDLGLATRRDAVTGFQDLFIPGSTVDIARRTDPALLLGETTSGSR